MTTKTLFGALLATACALAAGAVRADAPYPDHPIRILSPFPTGSGPDVVTRVVAEHMAKRLGQSVIVDARPGGNGFIALDAARRAAPAGYDIAVADVGHLSINPALFSNMPYDPQRDFTPIGGLYRTSFFVLVGANSPMQTIPALIAAARQRDGRLTYASNSVGGPLHLGAVQIEAAANLHMLHVPFKETSQVYNAVATGEVDWALGSIATAGPLIQAGKIRILAVADKARSPAMPDVPTLAEAGGPAGVEATTWVVMIAPKGTPPKIVDTLNAAVRDALATDDIKTRLAGFGFAPAPVAPAEVGRWIRDDTVRYAEMVKRIGAAAN